VMREPGSGTQATVERALSKLGLPVEELDVVCRLGSTAAVMEAVRRGVGVAWVSRKAAETPLEHGLVASVSVRGIKMERDCYLVLRRGRSVSPTSRAFQEILRETGRGKTGR
jgi:DNA-binding transcriptional LysR family regulator